MFNRFLFSSMLLRCVLMQNGMKPKSVTPPIIANDGKQQRDAASEHRLCRTSTTLQYSDSTAAFSCPCYSGRLAPLSASRATRHASPASRYQSDRTGSCRVLFVQNTAVISPGFASPMKLVCLVHQIGAGLRCSHLMPGGNTKTASHIGILSGGKSLLASN